jgi:hypothetical protein
MSSSQLNGIRARKVEGKTLLAGPAVPPKSSKQQPSSSHTRESFVLKPLPPVPHNVIIEDPRGLIVKPLPPPPPPPPDNIDVRSTSLWIAGLCLWFLTIVVLLPIIMEKDAMPGFNRGLRELWS